MVLLMVFYGRRRPYTHLFLRFLSSVVVQYIDYKKSTSGCSQGKERMMRKEEGVGEGEGDS